MEKGRKQPEVEQDKPVSPEDVSFVQQLLEIARTTAESLGLTLKEEKTLMAKLDTPKGVADDSVDTAKQQLSIFEEWIAWATSKLPAEAMSAEAMSADSAGGVAKGATEDGGERWNNKPTLNSFIPMFP